MTSSPRRRLLVVLLIVAVVCGAGVLALRRWRTVRMEEALAAIEALAYEVGDASRWPAGPWDLESPRVDDLAPEQRAAVARFLADRAAFFARLDAAADSDVLEFPGHRDEHGNLEWALSPAFFEVAGLLRARARLAADEEDRLRALETLLRIGRRWRPRSAFEGLVAVTLVQTGARETSQALAAGRVGAPAVARLAPLLADDVLGAFQEILRAERAWQLSMVDAMVDLPGVDDDATETLAPGDGFRREDVAGSLAGPDIVDAATRVVRLHEDLLALPATDHALLRDGVSDVTATAPRPKDSLLPWRRIGSLIGDGTAGLAKSLAHSLARADGYVRLARVALAAIAHREQTGSWPATPQDLAAQLPGGAPGDPRCGAPFVFETLADGRFRIRTPERTEDDDELTWSAPR